MAGNDFTVRYYPHVIVVGELSEEDAYPKYWFPKEFKEKYTDLSLDYNSFAALLSHTLTPGIRSSNYSGALDAFFSKDRTFAKFCRDIDGNNINFRGVLVSRADKKLMGCPADRKV